MLGVESAAKKRASRRRIGLALAGGGPLGSFYQLGALHALTECIDGLDLCSLRGYVGVSSGATLCACLANGLSTDEIIRSFLLDDESARFPLAPGLLMRPAIGEYASRVARIPELLGQIAAQCARDPLRQNCASALSPLLEAIPTGVFDNRPFARYLHEVLTSDGRTDDFRKLPCMLRVVATELDSGSEARFGEPGLDHVPISEAIRASTALPGLYTPVRIEGRTYVDGALLRTAHASLVLDQGADMVISINPLVTFDGTTQRLGRSRTLAERGFVAVMNQTFRALIQSRMQVGMARYHELYPSSDRLLLQPNRNDKAMFFANVFRYRDRCRLAEHAYQCTRRDLKRHARELQPILVRHGLGLRAERVNDRSRKILAGTSNAADAPQQVFARLDRTLARLSDLLQDAKA